MEIINLHKRCNKKVPQPKKAPFKSDGPKEAPKSLEYIDNLSEEEQKSKKKRWKKDCYKVRKKVKMPHSRKKHQSHFNLLTQAGKQKEGCPRMIKSLLHWG